MRTFISFQRVALIFFATFLLTMSVNTLFAQKNITLDLDIERTPLKYKGTPIAKKIDPMLLYARDRYENGEQLDTDQLFHVKGNEILIKAIAETPETAAKVIEQFKSIGLKYTGHYERVINGFLPFDQIEKASKFEHLMNLTYSPRPVLKVGRVTSEGDATMNTDIIKKGLGFDGTGVKIGILSDSYNALGNAEEGVLSGDLPGEGNPNGYTTPVEVLLDLDLDGSDEGRGMAELIHDVAPGAALSFYSAFYGEGAFAQGITALSQFANCDIIVDDVIYLAEPFFQDGVIAKAVDAVVSNGTSYFSAAGNSAADSYEAAFNSAGFEFNLGNFPLEPHVFPNGDIFQPITLPPRSGLFIVFQWDEPAASISGFPGSITDYNLIVFNEDISDIVDFAASENHFKDPVELLFLENRDTVARTYNLLIGSYTPTLAIPDNTFKMVLFGNPLAFGDLAPEFNKGTIYGHANAKGAVAVGAAPYFFTPAFGFENPIPENFTSLGGVPILFDEKGNRLETPMVRDKPEITAPDGTNNTFFGEDLEDDGFPNFFGTSAAAPHAAAAAALIIQAYRESGRSTSPDVILNVLQSTATDIVPTIIDRVPAALSGLGIPLGELQQFLQFDDLAIGFDYLTGAGLINAERALSDFADQIVYVDLSLTANTVGKVKRFAPNTLSFELTNSGDRAATGILVGIELPKSTPLVGGARPVASNGKYDIYTSIWSIPSLGVGESATLNLQIFPLTLDFEVFAQVLAFNELDIDSRPANGTCCIAIEDDEVVFRSSGVEATALGINPDFDFIPTDATLMIESIYPNPTTNQTTVVFYSQLDKVNYTIQDVHGRTLLTNQWSTEQGLNRKSIDLSGFAEGVYFLQIDKATPQRIIKLK